MSVLFSGASKNVSLLIDNTLSNWKFQCFSVSKSLLNKLLRETFVFDLSRNTLLKYYDNQIHRSSKRAYWFCLRFVPKSIAP